MPETVHEVSQMSFETFLRCREELWQHYMEVRNISMPFGSFHER